MTQEVSAWPAVTGRPGQARVLVPSVTRGGQPAFPATYASAVRAGGAEPVVVAPGPLVTGRSPDCEVRVVDPQQPGTLSGLAGLLLPGGGDLDPALYRQPPHPSTRHVSQARDAFEFGLLRLALDAGMPVLAICRGMQLLNIARGGQLIQDLPRSPLAHQGETATDPSLRHAVHVAPGSLLATIIGGVRIVNSRHHQGLGRLGTGITVTGRSPDSVVEAVELDGARFVVGVQWHPEDMLGEDAGSEELFAAFAAAAASFAAITQPALDAVECR